MSLSARLLSVAVVTGSVLPLAGPAAADSGPTSLPMASFARIVADEAHGHLFLSPGRTGSAVTVTDLSGSPVTTIGSLPGATGLALSADGTSLWVAEAKGDALARIDTTTLQVVQTVTLPAGTCPGDVAVVGSRVVYGYSCNTYGGSGSYGGLGIADAATGALLGTATNGPFYRPVLAAGPAGQVFAGDAGLSPSDLYLYDVTGSAPVLVAERASIGSNLQDLAASPDGGLVVTACGSPYEHDVYSADKLASAGVYASGTYPNAVAWSGDGSVVAVGTDSAYDADVRLYAAGGSTPLRTVDFGSGQYLQDRGLAVSADGARTWAVTGDVYGGSLALREISRTVPATPSLTLAADPPAAYPGSGTTLGGRLTSDGSPLGGVTMKVTRTVSATSEALPPVTTAADGTYHFGDTLPATAGKVTYRVDFAGDAVRAPASATTDVTVWSTVPTLTLRLRQPSTGSPSVTGDVTLAYAGGDSAGGVIVHVRRTVSGVGVDLPDVVTSPTGTASFTDTAPSGTVTYTVSVDATPLHEAATASASVSVSAPRPPATTLWVKVSATDVLVGTPVTVTGTLMSSTSAVAGREVTVFRTGCSSTGSSSTAVGSAVTGADGAYSVTDNYPPAGTCGYYARFAGDTSYAGSTSATVTVNVAKRTASLSLSAVRGSGKDKKSVVVTAHLGPTHVNRVVTISVTPSGGSETVLVSGTVDANGDLTATYQSRTTATYTATFDGDDWYLPAKASTTL
ncbi:MAG TPA: Ig-like domain-containing protein [Actinomycetes bacterium]